MALTQIQQYLLDSGFNIGEVRILQAGLEGERQQKFLATGSTYSKPSKIKKDFPELVRRNLIDVDTLRFTGIVRLTHWGLALAEVADGNLGQY